jgi:hypothetical protein
MDNLNGLSSEHILFVKVRLNQIHALRTFDDRFKKRLKSVVEKINYKGFYLRIQNYSIFKHPLGYFI